MPPTPPFPNSDLEAICKVLADTYTGLTGSEISRLLDQLGIADPDPGMTKWRRLHNALATQQNKDRCANNVVRFILEAMSPVRYSGSPGEFEQRRTILNEVLAFQGLFLGQDGKLQKGNPAHTLSEAGARAKSLRTELSRRGVHSDVLRFCQAELLQENYFHAVFEATKSVADKIRDKSGLTGDGSQLVDQAFGRGQTGTPLLAFNSLRSPTEKSEHNGIA